MAVLLAGLDSFSRSHSLAYMRRRVVQQIFENLPNCFRCWGFAGWIPMLIYERFPFSPTPTPTPTATTTSIPTRKVCCLFSGVCLSICEWVIYDVSPLSAFVSVSGCQCNCGPRILVGRHIDIDYAVFFALFLAPSRHTSLPLLKRHSELNYCLCL